MAELYRPEIHKPDFFVLHPPSEPLAKLAEVSGYRLDETVYPGVIHDNAGVLLAVSGQLSDDELAAQRIDIDIAPPYLALDVIVEPASRGGRSTFEQRIFIPNDVHVVLFGFARNPIWWRTEAHPHFDEEATQSALSHWRWRGVPACGPETPESVQKKDVDLEAERKARWDETRARSKG